jgi:hypothetical protein
MKRFFKTGFGAALLVCSAVLTTAVMTNSVATAAAADAASGTSAIDGLTSTKDHGVVSVMSDPTLADGRLVLKVVAQNRTKEAASFGPQNLKVITAAGAPVKLMSLDQLVEEARQAAGGSGPGMARNSGSHSGPILGRDSAGRPDVSGYTGGNDNMAGIDPSQARMNSRPANDDPKLKQQIESLNAAILHDLTIAPAAVAGGQVVTEKLKFGRKEPHDLKLVVDFNGEQHEFNFASPPAR